jgi:hypothetical protein
MRCLLHIIGPRKYKDGLKALKSLYTTSIILSQI